jgi:hypothetical protein
MDVRAIHELRLGVYSGLVANLAVVAVVTNPIEGSTRAYFTVVGGANEVLGVLMIASPELGPVAASTARNVARLLRITTQRAISFARRKLGLPGHVSVKTGGFLAGASASAPGAVVGQPLVNATIEERVAWLIAAYERLDEELRSLRATVEALPESWRRDIEEARQQSEDLSRALVRGLADRHLALRLLGLLFVLVGIVFAAVGNLV